MQKNRKKIIETADAIIIGAFITALTAILVAVITNYEKLNFLPRSKQTTTKFDAELLLIARFENEKPFNRSKQPKLDQKLKRSIFTRRSSNCRFVADYELKVDNKIEVLGKMTGRGLFYNNRAYLIYQIVDDDKTRPNKITGVMLLHIPEWNNITGYLMNPSKVFPGTTGVLFLKPN